MAVINWHDVLLNSDQDIWCEYNTKTLYQKFMKYQKHFDKWLLLTGMMCY